MSKKFDPLQELERNAAKVGLTHNDVSALRELYNNLFDLEQKRLNLIRQFVDASLNGTSANITRLNFLMLDRL